MLSLIPHVLTRKHVSQVGLAAISLPSGKPALFRSLKGGIEQFKEVAKKQLHTEETLYVTPLYSHFTFLRLITACFELGIPSLEAKSLPRGY